MYGINSALCSNPSQIFPYENYGSRDSVHPMNDNQELRQLSIAIASDSLQQRSNLRKVLEQSGLSVVLSEPLTRLFLRKLEKVDAEVLLLDLHDDQSHDEELLYEVLDKVTIPIIFNDVTALLVNEPALHPKWHLSLMRKIAESTGNDSFMPAQPAPVVKSSEHPQKNVSSSTNKLARNVWVLGASLGGPDALKRFLSALPEDIPAAFVVAQHLGANFVSLLAEQLNRVCRLNVMTPREGHMFQHRDVIIAPVGQHLRFNPIGNVELDELSETYNYSPSIDLVLRDITDRFGVNAGAIIFSGMGDDGRRGSEYLQAKGGQVWVQSPDSCMVSSMPDSVKLVCQPQFVGNPEMLARQLVTYLGKQEESQ